MSGLSPFVDLLERHPGRVFCCVGVAFVALYVSSHTLFPREGGRIIKGDAVQYYAYLRSWVVDGDLDFQNDYRLLLTLPPETEPARTLELGRSVACCQVGSNRSVHRY